MKIRNVELDQPINLKVIMDSYLIAIDTVAYSATKKVFDAFLDVYGKHQIDVICPKFIDTLDYYARYSIGTPKRKVMHILTLWLFKNCPELIGPIAEFMVVNNISIYVYPKVCTCMRSYPTAQAIFAIAGYQIPDYTYGGMHDID